MQLELLEKKHIDFLKRTFNIDIDSFVSMCEEDGEALEKLLEKLTLKECDASDEYEKTGEYSEDGICAIELIDIICGSYSQNDKTEDALKSTIDLMTQEQIDFICKEVKITVDELRDASEDFLDKIYDMLCDIECEETGDDDSKISDRGEIAVSLVTLMGNAIAESEGWIDEIDEDIFQEE